MSSALLSGGVFIEKEVSRGEGSLPLRLTDSSESEETGSRCDSKKLSFSAPEEQPPDKISLKTNTHNGLDTNKQKKQETLCYVLFVFALPR